MDTHFGIDYGAKTAGTTAICFKKNDELHVLQSVKKKNADAFIKKTIDSLTPTHVFIDAPLSLPIAYFQKDPNDKPDFFFRQCDKKLGGMSPMFLGGLTARAMKLQYSYLNTNVLFIETYPSYLVKTMFSETLIYKKKTSEIESFMEILTPNLPFALAEPPSNWHQVDSILAWLSGHRFFQKKALEIGHKKEGVIVV